jgi:Ca-activated chloride channel homolog
MPSQSLAVRINEQPRSPTLVSVDGRTYPLRSAQLRARAEGGIASSTLVQTFANPYEEPLEVVYSLPLPADGAVLGYTVRIGERVIRGEVQPREEAEAAYRQALFEGRTAGLLEEDRTDTFQQQLGNLPPRTDVTVEIEVLQPLTFLVGTGEGAAVWEYRFPTVVGPRYQGAPGRVSDAERLDLDRGAEGTVPARLGLELTLGDVIASSPRVFSPSHRIESLSEGGAITVRLAEGVRLDRDLVIQWAASAGEVGVQVLQGRGIPPDAGRYALLTLVPPSRTQAAHRRDLTVLIDASGSMGGQPLELAKQVVADLLRSLDAGDRFEVIAFANTPRKLMGLKAATPASVESCLRLVGALTAGGGTEMGSAIQEALSPLREDSQHQVVLVSDGYIGFEKELLTQVAHSMPAGVRLHTVGIGSAPNRALTRSLARGGRGVELLVSDEASAVEAARRLCAASARPVLTELSFAGPALRSVAPARPPDVFAGRPVVVAAELSDGGGALDVRGRLAGSSEEWSWHVEVPPVADAGAAVGTGPAAGIGVTHLPIGALFGREAISDAELELAAGGASEVLDARIEGLGLRHRVVSRRTSLVAISEEPSVDPRAPRRRERLAVELPAGVSAEGAGLAGGRWIARSGPLGAPQMMTRHMGAMGIPSGWVVGQQLRGRAAPGEITLGSFRAPPASTIEKRVVQATVVQRSGAELTIEFETPSDGFQLPVGEVEVLGLPGGPRRHSARLVVEKSSSPGPHAAGLILRLALRLEEGGTWAAGHELSLRWNGVALQVLIAPEADRGA